MSKIHISRKHELDADQCKDLAEDFLGQLVGAFGGKFYEQGGGYCYRHASGMRAVVEPEERELNIDVQLTFMTRSLAPIVEKRIGEVLDDYLGAE
jgi:hypothetical protein